MARRFTSLPAVNDLSLEGRVLRNTDWRWNDQVAYETNDIVIFGTGDTDRLYVALQAADGNSQSPSNDTYWRAVSDTMAPPPSTNTFVQSGRVVDDTLELFYSATPSGTADVSINVSSLLNDTTYTFTNGTDGSFTVTPSGGQTQTVNVGTTNTLSFNNSSRVLSSTVNGQESTVTIPSSDDSRTPMEIIRSAINDSYTRRVTNFSNGLPSRFVYTLANGETINADFTFVNGFPSTVLFSGDYIGDVTGITDQTLTHTFTFVDGLPTADTWAFSIELGLTLTEAGLIIEAGNVPQVDITDSGLIINRADIGVAQAGRIDVSTQASVDADNSGIPETLTLDISTTVAALSTVPLGTTYGSAESFYIAFDFGENGLDIPVIGTYLDRGIVTNQRIAVATPNNFGGDIDLARRDPSPFPTRPVGGSTMTASQFVTFFASNFQLPGSDLSANGANSLVNVTAVGNEVVFEFRRPTFTGGGVYTLRSSNTFTTFDNAGVTNSRVVYIIPAGVTGRFTTSPNRTGTGPTSDPSSVRIRVTSHVGPDETLTFAQGITTDTALRTAFVNMFNANTNLRAFFTEATISNDRITFSTLLNANFTVEVTYSPGGGVLSGTTTSVNGDPNTFMQSEIIITTMNGATTLILSETASTEGIAQELANSLISQGYLASATGRVVTYEDARRREITTPISLRVTAPGTAGLLNSYFPITVTRQGRAPGIHDTLTITESGLIFE